MATIRFVNVVKSFGPTRVVDRVNLEISAGELFFLLGPSGCGKTTLLRMLAGFLEPDEGEIYLDEQPMRGVPPRLRNTALVFQNYALWPHRTVAGNVAYGLEVRGLSRRQIAERVAQALKLVRLEGLADRRPTQLSGGQQQRVALARALIVQPKVLLLDEPLSNLDARLRLEMREEIRRLHRETGLTMVYVTHDQKEAMSLADRIAVMHQGRIAQVGTPREIYSRPASRFVADFMGDSNFIPGAVEEVRPDGLCRVASRLGPMLGIAAHKEVKPGQAVTCSIRPEALAPATSRGEFNTLEATVEHVEFLGETMTIRLRAADLPFQALALHGRWSAGQPQTTVLLKVRPEDVILLTD